MTLPLIRFKLPDDCGKFGAIRKHDVHTGIDLYCHPSSDVFAIEEGDVIDVGHFTGAAANSSWWNDTDYVVIKSKSGYILYGELSTSLNVGDTVLYNQLIGSVRTVLKKNKGRPMTMLHLELYSEYKEPVSWQLGQEKPIGLKDPTYLIMNGLYESYKTFGHEPDILEIPEGEWFTIAGRGKVMALDTSLLDKSIEIFNDDVVIIAGKKYSVRGIEYPSSKDRAAGKVGLLLKDLD